MPLAASVQNGYFHNPAHGQGDEVIDLVLIEWVSLAKLISISLLLNSNIEG